MGNGGGQVMGATSSSNPKVMMSQPPLVSGPTMTQPPLVSGPTMPQHPLVSGPTMPPQPTSVITVNQQSQQHILHALQSPNPDNKNTITLHQGEACLQQDVSYSLPYASHNVPSVYNKPQQQFAQGQEGGGGNIDLDDLLNILETEDKNQSVTESLKTYKEEVGCTWQEGCSGGSHESCHENCAFVRNVLGLDELLPSQLNPTPSTIHELQNVDLSKQTPQGCISGTLDTNIGGEQVQPVYLVPSEASIIPQYVQVESQPIWTGLYLQQPTYYAQAQGIHIEPVQPDYSASVPASVPPSYSHPSSFSIPSPAASSRSLPTPSPSPSHTYDIVGSVMLVGGGGRGAGKYNSTFGGGMGLASGGTSGTSEGFQCDQCAARCHDEKEMKKHARLYHQIYRCKMCNVQAEGYNQLLSHRNREHKDKKKEPKFLCLCGSGFGKKKALADHQITCSLLKAKGTTDKQNREKK
eukprot:TRINITY_DN13602_c0_g1_i6.p1 TRINITY_DN13602_c0_g1~~TRINITY_DN13602_c0_g1_i6.p1  ORF type:complete len:507 (-),score=111.54 TRINITY_DN13602_c0_g1_i6:1048-2445(-)